MIIYLMSLGIIIFYMVYKTCEKKKFKSTCCGGVLEVKADLPTPSEINQTAKPVLVIRSEKDEKELPV